MYLTQRGIFVFEEGPKNLDQSDATFLTCTYLTAGRIRSRSFRYDRLGSGGRSECPLVLPLCEPAFASDGPENEFSQESANPLDEWEWDRCRN